LKVYTDEQFNKEFPEILKNCEQCKKSFYTRFNAKFCCDRCFKKSIHDLRKKLGTWVKNEKRVKSTHRPDKNVDGSWGTRLLNGKTYQEFPNQIPNFQTTLI
jgi:hypothetical protein